MTSETIPFLDYKDIQKADRGEQRLSTTKRQAALSPVEAGSTFTCRDRQYFHL